MNRVLWTVVVGILFCGPALSQDSLPRAIVTEVKKATVLIRFEAGGKVASGSGCC